MSKDTVMLVPSYEVDGQVYPNTLSKDLEINFSNLDEDFCQQASLFAWYSTMFELADAQEARLKLLVSRVMAEKEQDIRAGLIPMMGGKITEGSIASLLLLLPEVQAVTDEYRRACATTGFLKGAKEAMTHRRDMLIQIGANVRASSELYLRK